MAALRGEEVCEALAEGDARDVERFLLNAIGDRRALLQKELAFVALAFDDFDALVEDYLHQVPQAAYDHAYSDRERFLRWLQDVRRLGPEQRTFVAYQQAEYTVMAVARKQRTEHLAFQRDARRSAQHLARLGQDATLRILLNPIHAWSWLALPGQAVGDVLFFAAGERVAAAVLQPVERQLAEMLARGPCTLAECASALRPVSPEKLACLCRARIAEGLLALE
jgi:hypothetical protein